MQKSQTNNSCANCENKSYCALYNAVTKEEMDYLEKNKQTLSFTPGETIIKQGIFASNIFYLKTGLLKQSVEQDNGKQIIMKIIQANQFLGIPIIEAEQFYPYSAVALKPASVCIFKTGTITKLINSNQSFCHSILRWHKQNYFTMYNKLVSIGTKNMHGRLADALLYLSHEDLEKEDVFKYITRKDIASLAAMSWESAMRIFNEFKHDRIIKVEGRQIIINDRQMLERLSRMS